MTHTRLRRTSWIGRLWGKEEEQVEDEPENKTFLQGFEWNSNGDGKHWDRLHDALPGLRAIGVDNLWLPPGCKATGPGSNGYDIYDLYDLGEFETHGNHRTKWGAKEQLNRLAAKAQEVGVGLYWDAVLNHRSGADRKETVKAVEVDPKSKRWIF
jgi:alpha-amylase